MKNKNNYLRILGWLLIVFAAIVFAIIFFHLGAPITLDQEWAGLIVGTIAAFLGVGLFGLAWVLDRMKRWNNLSLPEKCAVYAKELKKNKRKWRLGYYSDTPAGKVFFLPFSPDAPDEFGNAKYEDTTANEVRQLLAQGKIANDELTKYVIKAYYDEKT